MNIPLDTIFKTPRLSLRAVDFSDIDLVWDATRFEGFNDGMTWDPPASKEEIIQVTERNLEHWQQGKDYVFTVCLRDPAIAIGRVGLLKVADSDTWNIGFWVHPDYWSNGYASEAAQAVLDFGFDVLQAKKVVTAHAIWNKRSQHVIQGLGFRYIRENPEGFSKNGKPVAEYEYELYREGA